MLECPRPQSSDVNEQSNRGLRGLVGNAVFLPPETWAGLPGKLQALCPQEPGARPETHTVGLRFRPLHVPTAPGAPSSSLRAI